MILYSIIRRGLIPKPVIPVPKVPRPPGLVPGAAGTSLAWVTPQIACQLFGTYCTVPVKEPDQPGSQAIFYRVQGIFQIESRKVSDGSLLTAYEIERTAAVLGPITGNEIIGLETNAGSINWEIYRRIGFKTPCF